MAPGRGRARALEGVKLPPPSRPTDPAPGRTRRAAPPPAPPADPRAPPVPDGTPSPPRTIARWMRCWRMRASRSSSGMSGATVMRRRTSAGGQRLLGAATAPRSAGPWRGRTQHLPTAVDTGGTGDPAAGRPAAPSTTGSRVWPRREHHLLHGGDRVPCVDRDHRAPGHHHRARRPPRRSRARPVSSSCWNSSISPSSWEASSMAASSSGERARLARPAARPRAGGPRPSPAS